jgi:hypothetical protein
MNERMEEPDGGRCYWEANHVIVTAEMDAQARLAAVKAVIENGWASQGA